MSNLDLSILKPFNLYIVDPNRDGILTLEETKNAEAILNDKLKLEPDNSLTNELLRSAKLALNYLEQSGENHIKYFLGFDVNSDGKADKKGINNSLSIDVIQHGLQLYFDSLGDNNGVISLSEMLIMFDDDKRPYNYKYKIFGNIEYIEIDFLDNGTLYPDMAFTPDLHYITSYEDPASLSQHDEELLDKAGIKIEKSENKYTYTYDGKTLSLFEVALKMEIEYFLKDITYEDISEVNRLKKLFQDLGYVPLYNGNYGVDESSGYIDLDLYNLNTGRVETFEIKVSELVREDEDGLPVELTIDMKNLIDFFDDLAKKSLEPPATP